VQGVSKFVESSSGDCARQLRLLRFLGGRITRSSATISELPNGLPYFFVEVTCGDRSQFGIEAYGDEAILLEEETTRMGEICLVARSR
jgi:hypothetical protein